MTKVELAFNFRYHVYKGLREMERGPILMSKQQGCLPAINKA